MKTAVLLLSGGLDSATTLAIAQSQGYQVHTLSVDYGQRHRVELARAQAVAQRFQVASHRIVALDLRAIGGSALTANLAVPKDRDDQAISQGIPITYVPARNTVLLALALGLAETVQAFDLFFGANVLDYSGYPDCRPAFVRAFEALANQATKAAVEGQGTYRLHTPLIAMTKADIIRTGLALGVDYALTLSCYDPDESGRPCGRCDSCRLRQKGFAEVGIPDPAWAVG